ncbi:PP2C family protein-serine/threonine phosphatase [Mucispirillum schaedleri]|uniref:PP2C family protein-serine/threonine phosphatase n=1 Tax=Mucispirillum schaedleri TaxID=248039 RepID=UPI001F587948|nr:PP2C family protein-serine/threonine phosphatase [Mucispirillum schaedleri]
MAANDNNILDLLNIVSSDSTEDFIKHINEFFIKCSITDCHIWDVIGNICEPCQYIHPDDYATFDIYELGFKEDEVFLKNINLDISYFDYNYHIDSAIFFSYNSRITHIITFETPLPEDLEAKIKIAAPYFGKRSVELFSKERQMDLYINYQKKVDFVKRASIIFMCLEIEETISMSLSFFMDVFSADVVCAVYKNEFHGIGVNEEDLIENITIHDMPLKDYLININETIFVENEVISSKFNIKNAFFIYDESSGLRFALFNIIVDIVPDKDFCSLVSSIISIAVENALNHEALTKFKIEETEIAHTAEILNKFVKCNVQLENNDNIYGISYPARNAGGDFVNLMQMGNDYIFCVTDVCGKGYSAAVLTVVLSVFMSHFKSADELTAKVTNLNQFLISKNFDDRFITAFFGVYHSNTKELEYISCGHDPAAVLSKNNKIEYMTSDYMPMGIMLEDYKSKSIKIEDNSIIFIYTDGLIEYSSLDDLLCLVNALSDKKSKDIAESLYKELVVDTSLQKDDFTCLIMKI